MIRMDKFTGQKRVTKKNYICLLQHELDLNANLLHVSLYAINGKLNYKTNFSTFQFLLTDTH